jgi:hypothetical protein
MEFTPLINGKSYEWADIIVNIMGVPIAGCIAIEYSTKRDIKNVWGAGSYPVERGNGKYEATGKITLLQSEVEVLQSVAPINGDITLIPEFDITVVWLNPSLVTRKHILKNCRFMSNGRTTKEGEQSTPVDIDLVMSHVIFNGSAGLSV